MSQYDARPRARRNPAAMSSTGVVAIVATVLALAIGFVVLRRIDREVGTVTSLGNGSASAVGSGGVAAATPSATTPDGSVVATTSPVIPTAPPQPTTFTGATVIVANANATGGSAGKASTLLENVTDFQMGDPTNATGDNLPTSVIYFDSQQQLTAEPVARNLARMLKVATVAPLPGTDVVDSLGTAGVVLMLGEDLAGVTQNDLVPPLKAAEVAPAAPGAADSVPAADTTAAS